MTAWPPAYGVVRDDQQKTGVDDAPWAQLSMLRDRELPDLVICAAANCTKSGDLPPGRGSVSFTFTPDSIGLSRQPTAGDATTAPAGERATTLAYEDAARLTLFDAVAVSGAAVSPVMGKMTRPSMRILLAAANVRLGLWLPSPGSVADRIKAGKTPGAARAAEASADPDASPGRWQRILSAIRRYWRQPDLQHLWAEAAGTLQLDGRWLYVTDGGHYDNLGMVEALRRRPDHLIAVDASGDAPGRFATLGQTIALARSEIGVDVDIDPRRPRPRPHTRQCKAPYVKGTFTYPGEQIPGSHHLFFLKLAVPPDAPWDVIDYQQGHPTFPTDSTLQQLHDDQEFEAYRELGLYCAEAVLRNISY